MNIYLIIILVVLIGEYLLDLIVEGLNLSCAQAELPAEFADVYSAQKYKQAQSYLRENTVFKLIKGFVFTSIIVLFILLGGFNLVDQLARGLNLGPISTGLIFAGILLLFLKLLGLPFSIYHTFVIEERYGFNKTTVRTFVLDIFKEWGLLAIIGGLVFAIVLWFFGQAGSLAWVYCWIGLSLFQLFLVFIAPVVILPLFNKFVPLEEGPLKKAIEDYARAADFKLKGIFKLDASRRSSKSNAFFTGLGRYKRIALFDTLINQLTVEELVSVLAHEIAHYKRKHIIKSMAISIITTGLMFFILSFFINNPGLFAAFRMDQLSIYASLLFFGFLYTPISFLFSVFSVLLSRRHEYQADADAVSGYKKPAAFISALKKLSVHNLSNLRPHPAKVILHYSHPPILQRIKAIREISRS